MSGHYTYPSTRVHFGLGSADRVDTLTIRWPSGNVDEYLNVEANNIYWAVEDEGFYVNRVAPVLEAENIKVWPNPFSTSTTLTYKLADPATVTIIIYNQFGEQVRVVENERSTGKQQVVWNADSMAPGVYFCVLRTDTGIQTMKVIKL